MKIAKIWRYSVFLNSLISISQVSLKANKVTSDKTPLQYDYYDLPFCKRGRTKARADNIGERLSGDSLTTSPYEVCTDHFERSNRPYLVQKKTKH
jgi:hypothetical protein